MSYGKFSQLSYFDATSTASCVGSPLYIHSVGSGCNVVVGGNVNSRMCQPYSITTNSTSSNSATLYKYYDTSCINTPLDLGSSVRNYLVQYSYSASSTCEGDPLQIEAVAADVICHPYPGQSPSWFKANCNGAQPIWNICTDPTCGDCVETKYTKDSCQLTGAGASVKVQCLSASKTNGTSDTPKCDTLGSKPPGECTQTIVSDATSYGNGANGNIRPSVYLTVAMVLVGMAFM